MQHEKAYSSQSESYHWQSRDAYGRMNAMIHLLSLEFEFHSSLKRCTSNGTDCRRRRKVTTRSKRWGLYLRMETIYLMSVYGITSRLRKLTVVRITTGARSGSRMNEHMIESLVYTRTDGWTLPNPNGTPNSKQRYCTTTMPSPVTSLNPQQAVRQLIGAKLTCLLKDGRQAVGNLVCVDRWYEKAVLLLSSRSLSRQPQSHSRRLCGKSDHFFVRLFAQDTVGGTSRPTSLGAGHDTGRPTRQCPHDGHRVCEASGYCVNF